MLEGRTLTSTRAWMLVASLIAVSLASGAIAGATQPHGRALPSRLWGVTLDNTADINHTKRDAEAASLQALPTTPIARIVMDVGTKPAAYSAAIGALQPVSFLMAELGDSSEMKHESAAAYRRFEQRLVTAFRDHIDLWEIGNEVNGEWVGTAADEVAKISSAYNSVETIGGAKALTLYYNPDCSKPANEMFAWAEANIPAAMKAGLDYVFVSYYPNDCNDYWPTQAGWQSVFDRLHAMFPHAKLGFGESGISTDTGSPAAKAALLRRYYTLDIAGDSYLGGYFWWYYAEDAVPYADNKVWHALRGSMAQTASHSP